MKEVIESSQLYGDVLVQEVELIKRMVHETQNNDVLKRIFFFRKQEHISSPQGIKKSWPIS